MNATFQTQRAQSCAHRGVHNFQTLISDMSSYIMGFPHNSVGKASACNAGDPDSILGWEDPLKKRQICIDGVSRTADLLQIC